MSTAVASFPTAFPTRLQLLNAGDRASTNLSTGINNSTLTIPVASASRFRTPCLVTIDDEQILIGSKSGNNLVALSRGYAGTSAASHATEAAVKTNIGRWYHERLAVEIEALAERIADNRTYNFTHTSGTEFTGFVLAAGAQTITWAEPYSCPKGVAGANTLHYIRVSNGVTSEICLINGGTATGGGTGTLTFTTVNTYTGTVTISSATAGIQEAVNHVATSGGIGVVEVAEGSHAVYATTTVTAGNVVIRGQGMYVTRLSCSGFTTENCIVFDGSGAQQYNVIEELAIIGETGQTGGYAVYTADQNYFLGHRLFIQHFPNGVRLNGNQAQLSDVAIYEFEAVTGYGVVVEGDNNLAVRLDRIVTNPGVDVAAVAGLRVRNAGDVIVNDSHFLDGNYGILVDPGTGQAVASFEANSTYADNNLIYGIHFAPTGTGSIVRSRFNSCWGTQAGISGVYLTATGSAVINGASFNHLQCYLNGQNGFFADGSGLSNVSVSNSRFSQNSNSSPGVYHGALFNISNWSFTNNRSGPIDGFSNTQSGGLAVFAGSHDNYIIEGNDLLGNMTIALDDQGTGYNKVIDNNLPASANSYPDVAALASLPSGTKYLDSGALKVKP